MSKSKLASATWMIVSIQQSVVSSDTEVGAMAVPARRTVMSDAPS
jgi:hypothetical protein